jgi:2-(1,2-epoxy-1,2-dihydrophenyl)acetyl-CoA isomerase
MSTYETILVEEDAGVVTITLNRPEKYNALNHTVAKELIAVYKEAQKNETIRCLLLTGAGKGFCAGQDLGDVEGRAGAFSFREHLENSYHKMVSWMHSLEKPVVVAVNGACVGAGLGLALAGDIRFASDQAKFRSAFIGIGLVPDSGVSYWLPRLVGPVRAAEMLFTNDVVDAMAAAQMGLVNRVLPHEQLLPAAKALALRLAAGPTRAIGLTKRALNHSWNASFAEQLAYEAQLQDVAGHTADYSEGVAAFKEKRPAAFVGK